MGTKKETRVDENTRHRLVNTNKLKCDNPDYHTTSICSM